MRQKLIRFDWAMKKLLRHKANFDILEFVGRHATICLIFTYIGATDFSLSRQNYYS